MPNDRAELLRKLWQETRVPDPAKVAKLPKKTKTGGTVWLDYVGHADLTEILLAHDPEWNWEPFAKDERGLPAVVTDKHGDYSLWGFITIHGLTRICVGTCKADQGDPMKELIGDLLRNGAMRFGIAVTLWSKSEASEAPSEGLRSEARGSAPAPEPARARGGSPRQASAPSPPTTPPKDGAEKDPRERIKARWKELLTEQVSRANRHRINELKHPTKFDDYTDEQAAVLLAWMDQEDMALEEDTKKAIAAATR